MPTPEAAKTTTVRLSVEAKARLDLLQAKLTLGTGQKMTQEDLLGQLIDLGLRDPDDVVTTRRRTDNAFDRFMSLPRATGIRTDSSNIDEILYGGSE